jgi:DNA-binding NtrC family response regulator
MIHQLQLDLTKQESKGKVSDHFAQQTPLVSNVGGPSMADILVVDDDDVIRDTLCELLSQDYSCHTADTAEAALAKLEAQPFDVVLTDISMPGLSGKELLNRVVQLYPGTPVIVISGLSDQEQAESLLSLGAFDYLIKPFRLEVVEESVKRAVEQRVG